jgi:hypothetical protein
MTKRSLVCTLLAAWPCAACGQPPLADERIVFTVSRDPVLLASMQLSPDGGRLLYLRRAAAREAPKQGSSRPSPAAAYEYVLRDLSDGTEAVLPVTPLRGDLSVAASSSGAFDAKGNVVVAGGVDTDGDGVCNTKTEPMSAVLYDVSTRKAKRLGQRADWVCPMFDRTGRNLIVLEASREKGDIPFRMYTLPVQGGTARKLIVHGLPISGCCPTADLVVAIGPPSKRPKAGEFLSVLDLRNDAVAAQLPVSAPSFIRWMARCKARWTSDGRYLYYEDAEPDDPNRKSSFTPLCRVWDRQAKKEVARISDATIGGPGPARATMLLNKSGEKFHGFFLHHAADGKSDPPLDRASQLLVARGRRVLYAREAAKGTCAVYAAEIASAAKEPAPEGK